MRRCRRGRQDGVERLPQSVAHAPALPRGDALIAPDSLHQTVDQFQSVRALKDGSVLGFVRVELMAGLGSSPGAAIQRAKGNLGSAEVFAG